LISPAATALVQASITRVLVCVIPVALLTTLGFDQVLQWIEDPKKRLTELSSGSGPTSKRIIVATLILLVGIPLAFNAKGIIDTLALLVLAIVLALQISGLLERQASQRNWTSYRLWNLPHSLMALAAFAILAVVNIRMLNDALRNGPLWYSDYGMGGLQYGAFQVFDIIEQYIQEHPDAKIVFSPDWANGTDVVARFFMGDPMPIQMGSVRGHITQKLPLDDNTLFIITPQEYDLITQSEKVTDIQVERILPYPNGDPGFYFVHLRYVDNIDEIFAAEKAIRQVMQESTLIIEGQPVKVRHTYLDSDFQDQAIALVFDNDPYSVTKTYENNPFVIELTFPALRQVSGFSIIIGSAQVQVTLKCYSAPDAQPTVYTFEGQGTPKEPELLFNLPTSTPAQILQVEVFDLRATEPAKVHVWELKLR